MFERENIKDIAQYHIFNKDVEDKGYCAFVTCTYLLRDKNGATPVNQQYVLRKDEEGNWRILVFYVTEKKKEE